MPTLTTTQMQVLQAHIDAGNIYEYYDTLQSYGDQYGRLGKNVTRNDTWQGQLANNFAASAAAANGVDMSYGSPTWQNVNKQLASEYLQKYRNNSNATPTYDKVQEIHNNEYRKVGVPSNAWLPNLLLNSSIDPAAEWNDYQSNTSSFDLIEDAWDVLKDTTQSLLSENGKAIADGIDFSRNFLNALNNMSSEMKARMSLDFSPAIDLFEMMESGIDSIMDLLDNGSNNNNGGNGNNSNGSNGNPNDSDGDGRSDAPPTDGAPALPDGTPDKQASPLVFDLDGDGVELYAAGAYGTYFDLKNSGQAVLTGWVAPDDGLLTLDINANGKIDNGNELFGSETVDGFTVLKQYDSNNDGKITALDTVYNDLNVWTDLNSDGVSQGAELHSLSAMNITSINVKSERVADIIAGNTITHESSFVMNGINNKTVDAWFGYNPTITRNVVDYNFDIRAAFLPTLRGYGDVKDMHIAASIDNGADATSLIKQMIGFTSAHKNFASSIASWDDVHADVENILLRWAGVDGVIPNSRGNYVDAQALSFYEKFRGYSFNQNGSTNPLPEAGKFVNAIFEYLTTWESMLLLTQTAGKEIFVNPDYNITTGKLSGDLTLLQSGIDGVVNAAINSNNSTDVMARFAQFIGYTKGLNNLTIAEISALDMAVTSLNNPALNNWQDVVSYMTASLGDIIEKPSDWGSFEILYDTKINGTSGADVIDDQLTGTYINNQLSGLNGDDTLRGFTGHDKLIGGDGNDRLEGGVGDDLLLGGAGNDVYVYESGNDTLSEINGGGNDTLIISAATGMTEANMVDLYRYEDNMLLRLSNGDIITIDDYAIYGQGIETLVFEANNYTINLAALTTQKFYGTSDINNMDLTGESFQTLLAYGYAGNDTIKANGATAEFYGGDGYDVLIGGHLSDNLYGENDDDYLKGMDGNDNLYGGAGNDKLDGGAGNDTLNGGDGNNTYVFGSGYGVDTVVRQYTMPDTKVLFGNGITTSNISIARNASDLRDVTFVTNNGDQLIIDDMYARNSTFFYLINNFQFADGTVWSDTFVREKYIANNTTTGNDTVLGFELNEIFQSSAGDDYIAGYSGADIYYWGLGSGNDTIYDQVLNSNNNGTGGDTIIFTGNLNSTDFFFSKNGDDLIIQSMNTADSITVPKFYLSSGLYRIENFVFADKTLTNTNISAMTVNSLQITGTDIADTLNGTSSGDTINGRSGNDIIKGVNGNDTIYGGLGNDTIYGGAGADTLYGGLGADSFMFEKISAYSGVDVIKDFNTAQLDKLNLSDMLSGYNPLTKLITDFVKVTDSGANSILSVDRDGTGTTYTFNQIATIEGVTGLTDEQLLLNNGYLTYNMS